mgnify:CR=1 FL=1
MKSTQVSAVERIIHSAFGILSFAVAVIGAALVPSPAAAELKVSPTEIRLDRPEDSLQILVSDVQGAVTRDATRSVRYEVNGPAIVKVPSFPLAAKVVLAAAESSPCTLRMSA